MCAAANSAKQHNSSPRTPVLYLYAISEMPKLSAPPVAAEGIDGASPVEALRCASYLCWISRVSKVDFADDLAQHMQDLEWLAAAGLRHQRAVAEISKNMTSLPTRFGTVFLSEDSLSQHVKEREDALRHSFALVADTDEWGVKIFATAKPARPVAQAASGAEYLKRKAELRQPRPSKVLDKGLQEFVATMTKLSAAAAPGGKASAGQPGLVWHGSFLVRRKDRAKMDAVLKKYAGEWKEIRRIDCSGPWPPYSFVGEHVH